jgi:hypothetical protein
MQAKQQKINLINHPDFYKMIRTELPLISEEINVLRYLYRYFYNQQIDFINDRVESIAHAILHRIGLQYFEEELKNIYFRDYSEIINVQHFYEIIRNRILEED